MTYRIAIGEVAHETNTFCPEPTSTKPFKAHQWLLGDEIVRVHGGNRTYVGGMLDKAAALGVTPVPAFTTMAYPSGTITAAAYDEILQTLLDAIERAMPVDAICLSLHGAGVAEGVDDLEGAILAAVRGRVGPEMPIAVALDLHGNITPTTRTGCSALISTRTRTVTSAARRASNSSAGCCGERSCP